MEDSLGESSSNSLPNYSDKNKVSALNGKSAQNKAQIENSNSYESDDFEDISASGSGSKSKLVHWPGKEAFKTKENETNKVL